MKFTGHKYTWSRPFVNVKHDWSFRGPEGALSFRVHDVDGNPSCGMEFHHAFDRTGGEEAPSFVNCELTGGRCWHTGTSLYADEVVWPGVEAFLRVGDHDSIFQLLEAEYTRHFSQYRVATDDL